jgi:hypothetical protein
MKKGTFSAPHLTGVQFEISRIPLAGVVARLGWIYRAENVFGSLISKKLILYNASGVLNLISPQLLSKVFWKFQIVPPLHSDAYFGMDNLCQIKCR